MLALDSATGTAAVALVDRDGRGASLARASGRRAHALVDWVQRLMRLTDTDARAVRAIGVGTGPGSFTGVRLAMTAAKTLSFAWQCPLKGLSTLELLARGAGRPGDAVLCLLDAGGERVYAALYRLPPPRPQPGTEADGLPAAIPEVWMAPCHATVGHLPELVEAALAAAEQRRGSESRFVLAGDGAVTHADRLQAELDRLPGITPATAAPGSHHPHADLLAAYVWQLIAAVEADGGAEARRRPPGEGDAARERKANSTRETPAGGQREGERSGWDDPMLLAPTYARRSSAARQQGQ